jgi:hypothetical protein
VKDVRAAIHSRIDARCLRDVTDDELDTFWKIRGPAGRQVVQNADPRTLTDQRPAKVTPDEACPASDKDKLAGVPAFGRFRPRRIEIQSHTVASSENSERDAKTSTTPVQQTNVHGQNMKSRPDAKNTSQTHMMRCRPAVVSTPTQVRVAQQSRIDVSHAESTARPFSMPASLHSNGMQEHPSADESRPARTSRSNYERYAKHLNFPPRGGESSGAGKHNPLFLRI